MKCVIIGLGNFGKVVAVDLTKLGHEVIGADISESRVDIIKDSIATAFVMDSTDKHSLSALPLNDVDLVVVAIGENFGASIKTVALLKQFKVTKIFARAIDEMHKSVLEAFEIEKILTPEEEAATNLVQRLDFETNIETFKIDKEYSITKFTIPDRLIGFSVNSLKIQEEFQLKIIALKRANRVINSIGISITETDVVNQISPDIKLEKGDELVCYGLYSNFRKFWKTVS